MERIVAATRSASPFAVSPVPAGPAQPSGRTVSGTRAVQWGLSTDESAAGRTGLCRARVQHQLSAATR